MLDIPLDKNYRLSPKRFLNLEFNQTTISNAERKREGEREREREREREM